jgi:hypothetical protein
MDKADTKTPTALFALAAVGAAALMGVGLYLTWGLFEWLQTLDDAFVTLFTLAVCAWTAWVLTALARKRGANEEAAG